MRYGVILAGGGGTRLWPASRKTQPKQFLRLGQDPNVSLLQATLARVAPITGANQVRVVTAADQVAIVSQECPNLSADQIIAEPQARNTAAAMGLAAIRLLACDEDAVMGVIPSDQNVRDPEAFSICAEHAFQCAEAHDKVVTVGIVPTGPETGYGYLELGDSLGGDLHEVARFVEKPNTERAQTYFESRRYLWNAGMFFTKASRLLSDIERYLPQTHALLAPILAAYRSGDVGAARKLTETNYGLAESISIDYGVMEKLDDVLTLSGDFGWSDVGSWSALGEVKALDRQGNVLSKNVMPIDSKNNVTYVDDDTFVALVGVENLVVVKSGNAILVAAKSKDQDIRKVVDALKSQKREDLL